MRYPTANPRASLDLNGGRPPGLPAYRPSSLRSRLRRVLHNSPGYFSGAHSTATLRERPMTPAGAESSRIADADKLLRTAKGTFARKLPVGQITKSLSSPDSKNIPLSFSLKSVLQARPSRPTEGRLAIVTNAGRDAVDATASARNRGRRAVLRGS
jgi:hypothetical protein